MMEKILVIGASGFVGGRLARLLLAEGYRLRCLVRDGGRIADLAAKGCEIVQGDITDAAAVKRAVASVRAVYISIHTLSPQTANGHGQRFMSLEIKGVQNVIDACLNSGVHRVVYVTSLGITADSTSEWLRERWRAEQLLLDSGLDATVIRPGMIVGKGGNGFDSVVVDARKSRASLMGATKMRTIFVDDLVYYLAGVLNEPRAFGQRLAVGSSDVMTKSQMIDVVAELLGRQPPKKSQMPLGVVKFMAPLIERSRKMPKGALRGILDSVGTDLDGDTSLIRTILPREPLTFRQSAQRVLAEG
jgi:uncharacterized protein YbjT (DUF2867 family)